MEGGVMDPYEEARYAFGGGKDRGDNPYTDVNAELWDDG